MRARHLAIAGLLVLGVAGCGGQGTRSPSASGGNVAAASGGPAAAPSHATAAYDPRSTPLSCMRGEHLKAHFQGANAIRFDGGSGAPQIVFASTPDEAVALQLHGQAEGAEVIGQALLFVHHAPESELKAIEKCLDKQVKN